MSANAAISARDLSKRYVLAHGRPRYLSLRDSIAGATRNAVRRLSGAKSPVSDEFWALRGVSFDIDAGEVVGIVGRNGAGKSTLLKILSRITEPTRGTARLRGRIGSLLEVGTGFHPELTGRENVFLNGAIIGMSRAEIVAKFDQIVAFAEIERFLDTQVKHYSSGMYMRLAFAVAAHLDPDVLLVDEVLAVGDAQFQNKCLGKMEEAGKQGKTVLFVSHNMGSIAALCKKCILLTQGQIEMFDDTQKVLAAYNNLEAKRLTVEISDSMRNRGDGSIRFEACSVAAPDGAPKNAFLIGEELRLDIDLVSTRRGPVSFWLIVFDASGRPLLSTHQRDRELVEVSPGAYRLSFITQGLGLMPGNYSITAGAFDPGLKFLEWVDGCQNFEVYPCFVDGRPFDARWGAVNQDARWSLVPL